jgi:hypothetical protein
MIRAAGDVRPRRMRSSMKTTAFHGQSALTRASSLVSKDSNRSQFLVHPEGIPDIRTTSGYHGSFTPRRKRQGATSGKCRLMSLLDCWRVRPLQFPQALPSLQLSPFSKGTYRVSQSEIPWQATLGEPRADNLPEWWEGLFVVFVD